MLGDFTEGVTLLRRGRVQRADGGYDVTDAAIEAATDIWAAVRPLSGRESEEAGRLAGATTYEFQLYQDDLPDDITTDDQIRWDTAPDGAVVLNIRAIRMPRNREITVQIIADNGVLL